MDQTESTDFGYRRVTMQEKRERVAGLFDSVASRYDLMNDLMSMGIHRLWKRFAVHISELKEGDKVLDIAGGTGDMTRLFHRGIGDTGSITICDLSHEMIRTGRDRLLDEGIINRVNFVQGDAEALPFNNNSFDLICIAFGLRNVADKPRALASMYSKLKYGCPLLIMEFSKVILPVLDQIYANYSRHFIPLLGKYVAQDEDSYRYLIESIHMHPDQDTLKGLIEEAGFSRVEYINLTGGVVAIHKAWKI